jgi:glycosyltransferase involved in cell wall biosynthesis
MSTGAAGVIGEAVAEVPKPELGRAHRVYWVNQFAVTPDQAGGTRHHEMSTVLRAKGYDVRVVASDLNLTSRRYCRRVAGDGRRAIEEDASGVPFVWLPAGNYEFNDWRRVLSMVLFAWHVLRYLTVTVRRGDVVIGSSPQLPAALAARIAALIRRAPFILEVRDLWPESLIEVSGRRGLLTPALQAVAAVLYRTSSAIVILAEGTRDAVVRHGGPRGRIVFIPNGVDPAAFAGPLRDLPETLRWVEQHPTLVYAGAHGPSNGLDLVLDAAEVLRGRGDDRVRVLLVGDGPNKQQLRAAAMRRGLDNVVFHDPIPKELIPSLLRRCAGGLMILKDVELFQYGVSPNKLFDYMASGIPVVTNLGGEVARTVEEAAGGIVVPPRDAAAIADAMTKVIRGEVPTGKNVTYVLEHRNRCQLSERLVSVIESVSRGTTSVRHSSASST